MWGEEDILHNARVPLFHGSLPWRLVLRGKQEILGNPSPEGDLALTSSGPQSFSPLATPSWDGPQASVPVATGTL